jgi:hypothetical protein
MNGDLNEITRPEKLSTDHDLSAFDSGEPVLDDWLRRRALQTEVRGRRGRTSCALARGSWVTIPSR